jgi:hypothetical protein
MGYVDIAEIVFISVAFIVALGGFFYAIKNDKI